MKTIESVILGFAAIITIPVILSGCDDKKSYAELLTDENQAVNVFLSNQNVITSIPADSVFEAGPDAPYYQLDDEGNLYMQVLDAGDPDNRVRNDELVYFRFTRWNLSTYAETEELGEGVGNATDVATGSTSFRYGNYTLASSSQWGAGLQTPLTFLGLDCEVNIVIKSQYGLTSEIANVTPFLYNVRYYPAISN